MYKAIPNNAYSSFDYYPFGMIMPGRSYSAVSSYRFGFNNKEKDDEIEGIGNSIDFGARMYDSRLGRWLSVDPSTQKYPNLSPYIINNDNPVRLRDPNGKDPIEGGKEISVNPSFYAYNFNGTDMPNIIHEGFINDYRLYKKVDAWTLVLGIKDILSPGPPKGLMELLKDKAQDYGVDKMSGNVDNLITASFSKSYDLANYVYDAKNLSGNPVGIVQRLVQNLGNGFESMVTYKAEYTLNSKDAYANTKATLTRKTLYSAPMLNANYGRAGTEFKDFKYTQQITEINYSSDGNVKSTEITKVGINPRNNTKKCSTCD